MKRITFDAHFKRENVKIFYKILLLVCLLPNFSFADNADSLKTMLDTVKNQHTKSVILERLSEHYRYEGEFEISYQYLEQMKEVCESNNFKGQLAEYYNFKGINKCIQGMLDESIECMQKSLDIYIELDDSSSIANMYENIGLVYKDNSQFQKAIEYQLKSLEIRERNGFNERIPSLYCNIGVIYEKLEQRDKMKEYIYKAKAVAEKDESIEKTQLISIYNELGNVFDNDADLDSSLFYYNKGLELAKKINWKRGVSTILGNIADIYYDLKQYDKALKMHFESLELEENVENAYGIIKEHQFISRIYEELKKPELAEKHAIKAYDLAVETDMPNEIVNACEILSNHYALIKDFKKAYKFQCLFKEYSDSIANIDNRNYINDLEQKYQSTVKEQKIKLLTSENELHLRNVRSNRIAIIAISLVSITIALFLILLLRFRRKQAVLQRSDMEQKLLRNQMNPHFIFNALGAIQNFMYKNEPKEAGRYLGEFATLTRSILNHTREDAITLDEELQSLKSYLELEKLRLRGSFDYNISLDEDLETEFIKIPPMLIQPFIENAIKHGIAGLEQNAQIYIVIKDKGNFVQFIIEDNGIGIKHTLTEKSANHKSYAMKIFEERRKILRRSHHKSINFVITDLSEENKNGTRVILEIPIIT